MVAGLICVLALGARSQEARSEISLQGTGFFTKDSTGQATDLEGEDEPED